MWGDFLFQLHYREDFDRKRALSRHLSGIQRVFLFLFSLFFAAVRFFFFLIFVYNHNIDKLAGLPEKKEGRNHRGLSLVRNVML